MAYLLKFERGKFLVKKGLVNRTDHGWSYMDVDNKREIIPTRAMFLEQGRMLVVDDCDLDEALEIMSNYYKHMADLHTKGLAGSTSKLDQILEYRNRMHV